jgi:hypothetical protein
MLVCSHDGGIDDQVFEVRIFYQRIEKTLPNAFLGPSPETLEHAIPVAELSRQITPWCPRASDPEHRIDEQAIIFAVPSFVSFLTGTRCSMYRHCAVVSSRRTRSPSSVTILSRTGPGTDNKKIAVALLKSQTRSASVHKAKASVTSAKAKARKTAVASAR